MSSDDQNSTDASPNTPKPSIPQPNIPKPNIPTPNVPTSNIPSPNLPTPNAGPAPTETPRVSSFETQDPSSPTNQNAKLEETLAATEEEETILHKRVGAALIDFLVAAALLMAVKTILPDSLAKVAWFVQIGYLLTRDCLPFLGGQSLGKKALGLRAITEDGEPLTGKWQPGILRNILFVIPVIGPLVELIILYTREGNSDQGLRLGDGFANTKVVTVASLSAETPLEEASDEATSAE